MIEGMVDKVMKDIDAELEGTPEPKLSIFKGIDPEFHKKMKSLEGREKRQEKKFEKVAEMIKNQEHIKDPEKFQKFLKRNKIKVEF